MATKSGIRTKQIAKYFSHAIILIIPFILSCEHNVLDDLSEIEDCGNGNFEWFTPSDTTGEYYCITGVRLSPLDKEQIGNITHYYFTGTLRNQLVFQVQTEYKKIDSLEVAQFPDSAIVNDPIPGVVVNPIIWNEPVLRFNKDIQYKGQIIEAFENILNYDDLSDLSIFFPYLISPFAIHKIDLKKEDFQIERGCYELYAEWHTKDGLQISDSVSVFIDLK
ncbi:MAG: hypothetical protein ACE5NG_16015 [bacterium]